MRPTILTFLRGYLPGTGYGGPTRSIAHLVDRLGGEFRFRIVTRDRDTFSVDPYPGIMPLRWTKVGGAEVCYVPPHLHTPAFVRKVIRDTPHDALYLNSFFDPRFTLLPLTLRRRDVPVVVAPRGELDPGALSLKAAKKRLYLRLLSGFYRDVLWHASTELEAGQIRAHFGRRAAISVAPDLVAHAAPPGDGPPKEPGTLRLVWFSRITAKKNAPGALDLLRGLRGHILIDFYGIRRDEDAWRDFEAAFHAAPANVSARYTGALRPEEVVERIADYHAFLFPTLGENFGHVIAEAFLAGLPVIVSDRTPWRGLESRGVGWDLPLEEPERFRAVLQQLIDMDADEYRALRGRARAYGASLAEDGAAVEHNRALFRRAVHAT